MTPAALMLLAWAFELVFGWPDWLYQRLRHPVAWLGALISGLERVLNRPEWAKSVRYGAGVVTTCVCIGAATGMAWLIVVILPGTWWGFALQALIASSLIASRSLHRHVRAVASPLIAGDLSQARQAVSMIVGRNPEQLDEAGIARASLESLAENTSDGIIAPIFWGAIFGLPGLAAYKAINTLDSMIGHKNERYSAFGGFAARLDDVANLVPARLTGVLICLASFKASSFLVMFRDARHHRSPNAGWPEAAMAGGLDTRLSGPCSYGDDLTQDAWLNQEARDPLGADVAEGLVLYRRAMVLAFSMLGLMVLGLML
ncbi:MAG: adenosylcobinamide-phosphate synthase CbiB [Pseudomonadota bacterium]